MEKMPRILIIGDVMLDHYVSGSVERISPEAPVPVVKVEMEWNALGGAANVAANVSSLGAEAILIGMVGDDLAGKELQNLCSNQHIQTLLFVSDKPTITKTRVVSGQQIVRFDREEVFDWSTDLINALVQQLPDLVQTIDAVLVSDYAKGTLSSEVLQILNDACSLSNKKMVVDPKKRSISDYGRPYLVTPNLKELSELNGTPVPNDERMLVPVARSLMDGSGVKNLLITRSSKGMTLLTEDQLFNLPTQAQEVFDVSGAGDTVLAALGIGIASGWSLQKSVIYANAAAGVAVSKKGTATVQVEEVEAKTRGGNKTLSSNDIDIWKEKNKGKKVVFTNGCFDCLHEGHFKVLEQARSMGDLLVVGMNSDSSVRKLKGQKRPVNGQEARIAALSNLASVDAVVVFDEATPLELITSIRPDVLVKGGDYQLEDVVGTEIAGRVELIEFLPGYSSTELFNSARI